MLTGKRFKLSKPVLAFKIPDSHRVAVAVPAGTILRVVSGPSNGNQRTEVLWQGRVVVMLASDLNQRGTEIMPGRVSTSSRF